MPETKKLIDPMVIAMIVLSGSLMGCTAKRDAVLAATGTNIGVEISEHPATQMPQAKLGYNRAEFAFVPTSAGSKSDGGGSASDTADVVMELHYPGIFDFGPTSGIYQRLAVGKTAVTQPGAALLFARNMAGEVTDEASAALQAISKIPVTAFRSDKAAMARAYHTASAQVRPQFDQAAVGLGYADFKAFLLEANTSADKMNSLRQKLRETGLIK